ncbi:MAG: esterase [Bryobacterales bacterium]|nr:esterase [Bryobacterales bacterium]
MRSLQILTVTFIATVLASAQFTAPIRSPEVHSDKRVTFRLKAPNAKEVAVSLEGASRLPMQKGDDSTWTLTTEALQPDMYGYSFVADGIALLDPGNPVMKPNLLNTSSMVHVPSDAGLPWEERNVPRGAIHRHFYRSSVAGDSRDFYVYTPPSYRADAREAYPVLYLLHGYSDDARGWTQVGQAHVILDNLIAEGKARPMLVVMPLGYGTMDVIQNPAQAFRDPEMFRKNFDRFRTALLDEVMPQVESAYHARKDAAGRALAGLSMGGAETLYTALNYPDRFRYVGAFSFGGLPPEFAPMFPKVESAINKQFDVVWIACGVDDRLIGINRQFSGWLKEIQVKHEFVETPGAHTWMVWRRNLATFVPMLFTKK